MHRDRGAGWQYGSAGQQVCIRRLTGKAAGQAGNRADTGDRHQVHRTGDNRVLTDARNRGAGVGSQATRHVFEQVVYGEVVKGAGAEVARHQLESHRGRAVGATIGIHIDHRNACGLGKSQQLGVGLDRNGVGRGLGGGCSVVEIDPGGVAQQAAGRTQQVGLKAHGDRCIAGQLGR